MGKLAPIKTNRGSFLKFTDAAVRAALWKSKVVLKASKITLTEFLTKSRHDVSVVQGISLMLLIAGPSTEQSIPRHRIARDTMLETISEFLAISPKQNVVSVHIFISLIFCYSRRSCIIIIYFEFLF